MDLKILLSYISICCITGYFIIMAILHIKARNYNPIFHAVSDYGVGESKKFQIISGIFSIISALSLAIIFMILPEDFGYRKEAIFWFIIRIITVTGVLIFPTDIEGSKRTKTGLIHYLFAIIQFTAVVTLVINLTSVFNVLLNNNIYAQILSFTSYIVQISIIGVVLGLVVSPVKRFFGLIERIFLFSSAFYFLILSIVLINI